MELDFYLFINKISQVDFARKVGISDVQLSQYVKKRKNPRLPLAVRINELTDGKVTCKELIRMQDRLIEED